MDRIVQLNSSPAIRLMFLK